MKAIFKIVKRDNSVSIGVAADKRKFVNLISGELVYGFDGYIARKSEIRQLEKIIKLACEYAAKGHEIKFVKEDKSK